MTPPMTNDLIERLRAVYTKTDHRFGEFEGDCINPDGPEAAAHIETLAERVRELEGVSTWPISTDGPHKPCEHRVWLARQLLDSKLTDDEAYGIVAFSPAVSDVARQARKDKENG